MQILGSTSQLYADCVHITDLLNTELSHYYVKPRLCACDPSW